MRFASSPIVPSSARRLPALLLAAGISLAVSASAARATNVSTSFSSPGSYSFTVPAGVDSIDITAIGAAGGPCGSTAAGAGANVEATVPVAPGQQLSIGVGSAGAQGCGQSSGAGGFGGGGRGGQGGSAGGSGGGGGGASFVGVGSTPQGFPSAPLVVAAGGGGAGSGRAGGNAESPGEGGGVDFSFSGGAGTATAGGVAGSGNVAGQAINSGHSGFPGSFGSGGPGGDSSSDSTATGGGGGGGGYYGGGGGGGGAGTAPSGGGGGGSNFVIPSRTDVGTSISFFSPPRVTILYSGPTAAASASSLGFPAQAQGTAGAEQVLTLTNNGGSSLVVSAVLLGGAVPGDYLVGNRCQQPVDPGHSCQIGVRFSPQAVGSSSATLTVLSNATNSVPTVALSGTGVTLPQGAAGPAGPAGAAGAAGKPGSDGKVELITCSTVTHPATRHGHKVRVSQQQCSGKLISGLVKFTVSSSSVQATISRAGQTYGTGTSVPIRNGGSQLVITPLRPLHSGRYTLTLVSQVGGRRIVERRTLTVR